MLHLDIDGLDFQVDRTLVEQWVRTHWPDILMGTPDLSPRERAFRSGLKPIAHGALMMAHHEMTTKPQLVAANLPLPDLEAQELEYADVLRYALDYFLGLLLTVGERIPLRLDVEEQADGTFRVLAIAPRTPRLVEVAQTAGERDERASTAPTANNG